MADEPLLPGYFCIRFGPGNPPLERAPTKKEDYRSFSAYRLDGLQLIQLPFLNLF
jgi:hypothetical protein